MYVCCIACFKSRNQENCEAATSVKVCAAFCQSSSTYLPGKRYFLASVELGGFDVCNCSGSSTPPRQSKSGKAVPKALDSLQLTQKKRCVWWRPDLAAPHTFGYYLRNNQAHAGS